MRNKVLIAIFIILASNTAICLGYLLANKQPAPNHDQPIVTTTTEQTAPIYSTTTNGATDPSIFQDDSLKKPTSSVPAKETIALQQNEQLQQSQRFNCVITVNTTTYPLSVAPSTTIYDAMRLLQIDSRQPFSFSAKEFPGAGMFVEEINGVKNDNQTNKYWILYINGQSAKVGASAYNLKEGDKIEWKYEESKF